MKHSVDELVAIVYRYYPRDCASELESTEAQRLLVKARKEAATNRGTWSELLRLIEARFPKENVEDRTLHLPTGQYDGAYGGRLYITDIRPDERYHYLGIFISFLAPYYVIYSATCTDPTGRNSKQVIAFDFNADERRYVDIIRNEIHDVFPDHFPLGPEIGNVLVPDVNAGGSRVYDLVFSEDW